MAKCFCHELEHLDGMIFLDKAIEELSVVQCKLIDAVSEKKRSFMSKVIMMCGVCGSGKTTYAKKKEQEGYIRLSIDEEMWKLYGRKGFDNPEEQYVKL